jgi:tetratricopeptide (TPR) repeat protein
VLQSRELSADQKAQLKQQAQQFETQLASNSQDVEALEGAGVSYAQLGDFKRAEALLSKLTSAKPKDPEAWRLLVWSTRAAGEAFALIHALAIGLIITILARQSAVADAMKACMPNDTC